MHPPLVRIFIIRNNVNIVPSFTIALSISHPLSFSEMKRDILKQIRTSDTRALARAATTLNGAGDHSTSTETMNGTDKLMDKPGTINDNRASALVDSHPKTEEEDEASGRQRLENPVDTEEGQGQKDMSAQHDQGQERGHGVAEQRYSNDNALDQANIIPTESTDVSTAQVGPMTTETTTTDGVSPPLTIKAYTSYGLSVIKNDEDWSRARDDALRTVHMEGVVKVVVEI